MAHEPDEREDCKMETEKIVTVLTPTYNRAYILPVLYDSLCRQTDRRFVWLVADDGSADETRELVSGWKSENRICISYLYQENGGRHRAFNEGVRNADTELLLLCDSDDYLTENAIESVIKCWQGQERGRNISGIIGYRGQYVNGMLQTSKGMQFPDGIKTTRMWEIFRENGIFESVQIYRVDVLKENLYPEYENEKYIPPVVCWMQIDLEYEVLVLPEILEIYEYLEDGITKNGYPLKENYKGYAYLFYNKYRYNKKFAKRGKYKELGKLMAVSALCGDFSLIKGLDKKDILLSIPMGVAAFFYYIRKKG